MTIATTGTTTIVIITIHTVAWWFMAAHGITTMTTIVRVTIRADTTLRDRASPSASVGTVGATTGATGRIWRCAANALPRVPSQREGARGDLPFKTLSFLMGNERHSQVDS